MERQEKIQEIISFIKDHPESQASIAVGRRLIGVGENIRSREHLSELSSVLAGVDDEELEACFYIIS